MKKLTLLTVLVLSFFYAKSQEISHDQWIMITKTSASWCSPCGTWGWDLYENLIEDNKDKNALIWVSHDSGNFQNQAAIDLNTELKAIGRPEFILNNDVMPINSSQLEASRQEFNIFVDAFLALAPLAGVGLDATYDGETLNVTGKAEFFSSVGDGDYHLALYLLKDHVIGFQSQRGNDADHRFVLTNKITESTFGEAIVQGAVEEGATYTIEASIDVDDLDLENDEVVAILWNRRVDGDFVIFNANKNTITPLSSIVEIEGITEITSRMVNTDIILDIYLEQELGKIQSRLINVMGQVIQTQNTVSTLGLNQISYATSDLTAGTYLVQLVINDEIHTEKIVVP